MTYKINRILENRWFPVSLKVITLLAFGGLIIIGYSSELKDPMFLRQLSRTNLTTSFVWRLWWPLIIVSSIFFGRVWCMVCPVEMITSFFARIGLKLKRPQWILSGWVITVFYAIIVVVGITIIEIDRNPFHTTTYLLVIIGISILSGLVFEKNTFCRYICPVGYVLAVFSRMSAWGWRVKDKEVCTKCPDKSCISNKYRYQLNLKSCGVDLVPADISNNNYCILCSGCLKTCSIYQTNSNPSRPNPAYTRIGFASDLMQLTPLLLVEWIFLYFMTAHLIDEVSEFQIILDLSTKLFSGSIFTSLGLTTRISKNLLAAGVIFLLYPVFLWGLPYLYIKFRKIKISFAEYLKNISIAFIPVIIGLFVGLIIMEIAIKVPYYKFIAQDVTGVEPIRAILTRQVTVTPLPYWLEIILFTVLISSTIAGLMFSFKMIIQMALSNRIKKENTPVLKTMVLIFTGVFFTEVVLFLFL